MVSRPRRARGDRSCQQIEKLKLSPAALVASLTATDQHYKAIADFMAPQGKFGLIDNPAEFTIGMFKGKRSRSTGKR
jgi:hypothetical protein